MLGTFPNEKASHGLAIKPVACSLVTFDPTFFFMYIIFFNVHFNKYSFNARISPSFLLLLLLFF